MIKGATQKCQEHLIKILRTTYLRSTNQQKNITIKPNDEVGRMQNRVTMVYHDITMVHDRDTIVHEEITMVHDRVMKMPMEMPFVHDTVMMVHEVITTMHD